MSIIKCLHIAMAYRNYCNPFHYPLEGLQWSWGNDGDTWRGHDWGPWFHGSEPKWCHVFGLLFIVYNEGHVWAEGYISGHPAGGRWLCCCFTWSPAVCVGHSGKEGSGMSTDLRLVVSWICWWGELAGELLTLSGDIVGQWKEYFEELLNPSNTP